MYHDPNLDALAKAFSSRVRDQLRRARENQRWTVEDLCDRLKGISVAKWNAYEGGDYDLYVTELEEVCRAFGLEARVMIYEAYEITRHQGNGTNRWSKLS